MTLYKKLDEYRKKDSVRLHMPGHKGRGFDDFPPLHGIAPIDITEIDGFDDLHHPEGIILDVEKMAEALWGTKRCFISTNGSTGCILSAISAAYIAGMRKGKNKIALARNCHKSVYHAVEITGAYPVYIMPQVIENTECYGGIDPCSIEKLFEDNDGIAALVITSPTYEGVISDIKAIGNIVHSHGALLIVDEAHGSHLEFIGGDKKLSAVHEADMVIHSLHKTLSALGQSSALHITKKSLADVDEVARQMGIFTTSSPSYPIMASVDHCLSGIAKNNPFDGICELMKNFEKDINGLKNIRSIRSICRNGERGVLDIDPLKVTLFANDSYILSDCLRESGIECEYSDHNHLIAMAGQGTNGEDMKKFCRALADIDSRINVGENVSKTILKTLPMTVMSPREAVMKNCNTVPCKEAVGRISASYLWLYPPGIPFLVPGEMITDDTIDIINGYKDKIICPGYHFNGKNMKII